MKTLVVLTGGTFSSVDSDEGLFVTSESKDRLDLLRSTVESYFSSAVEVSFVQPFAKLSENFLPSDWERIFFTIAEQQKNYDTILVIQGTDTMAYSASALSYLNALKLESTIVLTGANHPLSKEGSDALTNFIQSLAALLFFHEHKVKGVFIVFNGTNDISKPALIHLGTRVKKDKWDTSCYRSFYIATGNKPSIGVVQRANIVEFDKKQHELFLAEQRKVGISVFNFSSQEVAGIKIYPGLQPNQLPLPSTHGVRFILLEIYNSGTAPADTSELSLVPWVRRATQEGAIVFAISQHEGNAGVSMNIYETSEKLLKAGIIPLQDIIWEAALPKLMLAASNFQESDDIIKFMKTNLAGEITPIS